MDKMCEDEAVSTTDRTADAMEPERNSSFKNISKTAINFVGKISSGVQRAASFVGHVLKGGPSKKGHSDATADLAAGDAGKNREKQFADGRQCNIAARRKRRRRCGHARRYLPRLEGELSEPRDKVVIDAEGAILPNFCHLSDFIADKMMQHIYAKLPLADLPIPHIISGEKVTYTLTEDGMFDVLGTGAYGAVHRGRYNGHTVAIKLFQKRNSSLMEILDEASKAVYLNDTKATAHCYGLVIINRSPLYHTVAIVSEFIGGDGNIPITLQDLTNRNIMDPKDPILNGMTKKAWFKLYLEVCEAVQKCHNAEVIIADIKCDNVLLYKEDGAWHPVLIDFGNAQFKSNEARQDFSHLSEETRKEMLEIYIHVAPEYINDGISGKCTDVFSLGAMLQLAATDINTAKLNKVIAHCKNPDHNLRSLQYVIKKIKKVVKAEKK